MSKANDIASRTHQVISGSQTEEARKKSEFLEKLDEYRSTLNRYIQTLPSILIRSGVSEQESQAIMTTLKAEQFGSCQDLVEEAYAKRIEARKKDDPPNMQVSQLESMAGQIEIIAQRKEDLNKDQSTLYPEGD